MGSWGYQQEVDEIKAVLSRTKSDLSSEVTMKTAKILSKHDTYEAPGKYTNRLSAVVYKIIMYQLWVGKRLLPAWEAYWSALLGRVCNGREALSIAQR